MMGVHGVMFTAGTSTLGSRTGSDSIVRSELPRGSESRDTNTIKAFGIIGSSSSSAAPDGGEGGRAEADFEASSVPILEVSEGVTTGGAE